MDAFRSVAEILIIPSSHSMSTFWTIGKVDLDGTMRLYRGQRGYEIGAEG